MSFDIQRLLRPAALPGRGTEWPRPRGAGFAQVFSDLLAGKDLVDPAAVGRARRASEAASERFDLVLVKPGLISEADLCLAYAIYCALALIEPGDLPALPVLPISFDGRRGNTGYSGRTTISELLVIDDSIRETIGRRSQDQRAIEQIAREAGFHTLYEDGLLKVGAGETSLDEVLRVTRAS